MPFFSISGSDFVEMFVGVGASRVRDLFEQAKQNAPCIIFMDEIDAVGRQRGAGLGGGHDEREQTLNQLLVEMDGFELEGQRHPDRGDQPARHPRPGAAAPRALRPPDRRRPPRPRRPRGDPRGPRASGKPLAEDVDLDALAGQTPGFTGADLANLVNEAALLAARHGKQEIEQARARGGDQARDRRPREEDAPALREGAPDHRLPRDGPRARRALPRGLRPGAQDLHDLARPGARLHDLAADRGHATSRRARQLLRHARDDARRARGRGARLRRDHHGRRERPREGHGDGEGRWSCASA